MSEIEQCFPSEFVWRFEDWTEAPGDIVEFRLVYKGKLPAASASDTRMADKHRIRCELHRQIKTLWQEHPSLKEWMLPTSVVEWGGRSRAEVEADRYNWGDMRFLPLINQHYGLACSLDILFLRRDVPGSAIISGGDIDNRLKVLIDALKMPRDRSQITKNWLPTSDENPLFCLLEDDKLINEIRVETDRLILPLEENERRNDVVLVIHVTTKVVNFDKVYIEFM